MLHQSFKQSDSSEDEYLPNLPQQTNHSSKSAKSKTKTYKKRKKQLNIENAHTVMQKITQEKKEIIEKFKGLGKLSKTQNEERKRELNRISSALTRARRKIKTKDMADSIRTLEEQKSLLEAQNLALTKNVQMLNQSLHAATAQQDILQTLASRQHKELIELRQQVEILMKQQQRMSAPPQPVNWMFDSQKDKKTLSASIKFIPQTDQLVQAESNPIPSKATQQEALEFEETLLRRSDSKVDCFGVMLSPILQRKDFDILNTVPCSSSNQEYKSEQKVKSKF